jgi:prepilin peptidase CpaA
MTAFPVVLFSSSFWTFLGGALFSAALVMASVTDVRSRRIPNTLVLALGFAGILYSVLRLSPVTGIGRALLSLVIGFGLWIPFYAFRMLGAGDVKLFAAASAWLAPSQVFAAAFVSAIAGGVLSVIGLVLAHGVGLATFRIAHGLRDPRVLATPLAVPRGRRTLPYGLAMSVGLVVAAWFPRLLKIV